MKAVHSTEGFALGKAEGERALLSAGRKALLSAGRRALLSAGRRALLSARRRALLSAGRKGYGSALPGESRGSRRFGSPPMSLSQEQLSATRRPGRATSGPKVPLAPFGGLARRPSGASGRGGERFKVVKVANPNPYALTLFCFYVIIRLRSLREPMNLYIKKKNKIL